MKKIGKIIENIVVFFTVIIVLFFVAMIVLPRFDYGLVVIRSGSMEPTIKTGSAILIKSQNAYDVGDVITFVNNKRNLVTHRIVKNDRNVYTTKGDNNNAEDIFTTPQSAVRGRVIFTLSYIGYLIAFLQSRLGVVLLILIPAGYFIGREGVKIKNELKKRKKMEE